LPFVLSKRERRFAKNEAIYVVLTILSCKDAVKVRRNKPVISTNAAFNEIKLPVNEKSQNIPCF